MCMVQVVIEPNLVLQVKSVKQRKEKREFKKKGKNYSKKKKHELYKISDKTKIAKKIFKNLYTKKFNNFFQLAPSLAFSIKNNLSIYKKIKSLL